MQTAEAPTTEEAHRPDCAAAAEVLAADRALAVGLAAQVLLDAVRAEAVEADRRDARVLDLAC